MFKNIKEKIVAKLQGITTIQEVFPYEVEEMQGDPSVSVSPSSNDGDYNTTAENLRIYAFVIRVYVSRNSRSKEEAERVLTDVIDDIIDTFDKDYTLTGISLPTGYTFINTFVLPSTWGYSGRESEYRSAELLIKARVSVDLSNI